MLSDHGFCHPNHFVRSFLISLSPPHSIFPDHYVILPLNVPHVSVSKFKICERDIRAGWTHLQCYSAGIRSLLSFLTSIRKPIHTVFLFFLMSVQHIIAVMNNGEASASVPRVVSGEKVLYLSYYITV